MHGERDDKGLNNYLFKINGSRKVNGVVQCTLHLIQRNVSIIKAMNSRKKKRGFFYTMYHLCNSFQFLV